MYLIILYTFSGSTPGSGLSPGDLQLVEDEAEILLADVPVIIDVAQSAKRLQWAASTWAGQGYHYYRTTCTSLDSIRLFVSQWLFLVRLCIFVTHLTHVRKKSVD